MTRPNPVDLSQEERAAYKPFSPLRRGEGGSSRSGGGTVHEKWYSDKVLFLFLVNIELLFSLLICFRMNKQTQFCSSFIFFCYLFDGKSRGKNLVSSFF
ncbi:unnamed protein product [Musa acuminata var. zebrina]